MRRFLLAAVVLTATGAAHHPLRPHLLGYFADWVAATHPEAGVPVCYAFTRALVHPDIVLTVTRRSHGHDTVAVSLGYRPREHGPAYLQVGPDRVGMYVSGRSTFARHGGAAVGALIHVPRAYGNFPGRGIDARQSETFSMKGLADAYAAAGRGCPEP